MMERFKGFTTFSLHERGFTLVEILVVISVLSIVGVIITTIFVRNLQGSNKTQIILSIKQNSQIVLENMDKNIRNADAVVCVFPAVRSSTQLVTLLASENQGFVEPPHVIVVVKDGIYTRYRFIPPSSSANGLIQQDNPGRQDVADSDPLRKETDSEFIRRACQPNDPMLQAVSLTDTNPQTGVSIDCPDSSSAGTCPIFKWNKSAGFKDQVTIKFIVKPGVTAPTAVAGRIDPVTFETTVQLR